MDLLPKIPGQHAEDPYKSLIEEYLLTLFQKGYAQSTIRAYGWHNHKLGIWLKEQDYSTPQEVDRSALRRWGAELRGRYMPSAFPSRIFVIVV